MSNSDVDYDLESEKDYELIDEGNTDEISFKRAPKSPNLNKKEREAQKQTFIPRASIKFENKDYRMWMDDMDMILGDKQRTKALRDSIIVCFRNLRQMKYVPNIAYNQLCYWLDTDYYVDDTKVQGLTSLTALKKHNLVYQPYPNHNPDWDCTPFRLKLKEDYESVGMTLFKHLYWESQYQGYMTPPFFHWERWYNNKCTLKSGWEKAVDRWEKTKTASDAQRVLTESNSSIGRVADPLDDTAVTRLAKAKQAIALASSLASSTSNPLSTPSKLSISTNPQNRKK